MKKPLRGDEVFGLLKQLIDVHTLGMSSFADLLRNSGYAVFFAPDEVNAALQDIRKADNYGLLKHWIVQKRITVLGFSYRLDPDEGYDYFMSLYVHLQQDAMFASQGGQLRQLVFAGLPDTCRKISHRTNGEITVYSGDETPLLALQMLGVPTEKLPPELHNDDAYDSMRRDFAESLIASEKYKHQPPPDHYGYLECGRYDDSYLLRLQYAKSRAALPIIRTHSGPYNPNRLEALKEFNAWCRDLAQSRLLDVLSIGSSQLTQSHFGQNWDGLPNGGGVPVNSETEYRIIKANSLPMLVRTYSGTRDVLKLAKIHERALNISWHALSFWWFDELDGRGSNTLLQNLNEHFATIRYAATVGKPVEPNVPHHFAFRGCDDVSYVVSAFLAAKACKKAGVRHLILQNMLNTPKATTGIHDLAKSRAMLRLVRQLEDRNFKVSLQTRAGLDYFTPDFDESKVRLAAATCLMDDIEAGNNDSPEIVHVVNYCEAVRLATPAVIKESIQITLSALHEYRAARRCGKIPDMSHDATVADLTNALYDAANTAVQLLEHNIPDLYSPGGFYKVFVSGFLPVPFLPDVNHKFPYATRYRTTVRHGGVYVVDEDGNILPTPNRYQKILSEARFLP